MSNRAGGEGRRTIADARHCRGSAAQERAAGALSGLRQTIEAEIIPRLVLAHSRSEDRSRPDGERAGAGGRPRAPSAEDVDELARLVITHEGQVALAYVEALRTQGMTVEAIYAELLAPAARRLGDLWEQDLCDFTEVTVGLWRLQQVMRALSPTFQNESSHPSTGLRALLVPLPGEHHIFGVILLAEFFRRAGWEVWDEPCASVADLVRVVRAGWFDLAGLSLSSSLSCEDRLEHLAAAVRAVRRASRNPRIGVLVTGRIFLEHPEYAVLVGADATAVSERQALPQAHKLLKLLVLRD